MALTLSLRFPTERYVAAAMHNRDELEWPPHPARLMLGLLATHYRHAGPPEERAALQWLCEHSAPEVRLPPQSVCIREKVVDVFVPSNTGSELSDKTKIAKLRKGHYPARRCFPSLLLPEDLPLVVFHWPDAEADEDTLSSLRGLLKDFSRFGHSSSLVAAELIEAIPDGLKQRLVPLDAASNASPDHLLRVPWPGLLDSAETAYAADLRDKELLASFARRDAAPGRGSFQASPRGRYDPRHVTIGYTESSERVECHSPWESGIFVLHRKSGDRLGLEMTWALATVLHKTLLDRWQRKFPDVAVPSWISGHQPGGANTAPLAECHLAIFPLPFVDSAHADGGIKGIGCAFPRSPDEEVRTRLRKDWRDMLGALMEDGRLELLPANKSWRFEAAVQDASLDLESLRSGTWTKASIRWSSVTPIILDRHPKPSFRKDPEGWQESCRAIIATACLRIGLPLPVEISVSPYTRMAGVLPAPAFPAPEGRPGRPPRFHVHAEIEFSSPVVGPVLIGAGRYRGYGLMKPSSRRS
jgi:CRISPR-associated protein Csb2